MEKEGKEAEKNDGPKPDVTRNLGLRIEAVQKVLFVAVKKSDKKTEKSTYFSWFAL